MSRSDTAIPLDSFQTFGDLLKYLRRRARLTQRELSIAVKYSEAQISRLEQNQRPPDLSVLAALFIPALYIEDEPEMIARLMELGAQARGESLPSSGSITFSRPLGQRVPEDVRTVEEETLNNLPLPLTSFVGRNQEIAEIIHLLDKDHGITRLLTLTGSGGSGKTRLAPMWSSAEQPHPIDMLTKPRNTCPEQRANPWFSFPSPYIKIFSDADLSQTRLGYSFLQLARAQ